MNAVAFHPKGHALATAGADLVRLWNPDDTDKRPQTLGGHPDQVRAVAFHRKDRTIATGSDDNTIRLWDSATGEPLITSKEHTQPVTSVAFSPDGDTFATADDSEAHLRDPETGESEALLNDGVNSLAFSPDGRVLATASVDGTVEPMGRRHLTPSRQGHRTDPPHLRP